MGLALLHCDLVDGIAYYAVCLLKDRDTADTDDMMVSKPGAPFAFVLCDFWQEVSLLNFFRILFPYAVRLTVADQHLKWTCLSTIQSLTCKWLLQLYRKYSVCPTAP